jgi:hypothetical protein
LKYLHKQKAEFLICGDINTDYVIESNWKEQLSSLLTTYNLSHTVDFATRIQNKSSTAIATIFMDNSRLGSSITSPLTNGLSDYDAQLHTVNTIYAATHKVSLKRGTRLIVIHSQTFRHYPKTRNVGIYQTQDTNYMFNSFLSTFLNICEANIFMECLPCIFYKIENNHIQQMHFSMFIIYTNTPTCFGPSGSSSGSNTQ